MSNSFKQIVLLILAILLLSGCFGSVKNLDTSKYNVNKNDKRVLQIPKACKDAYKTAIPRVAVVNITNNSTFGKANISKETNNKKSNLSVGGIGITNAFAIGAKANSNSKKLKESRKVDAKLSQSIASLVETKLLDIGGSKIYSREDLDKIMKEQKLQQSGLMDDNTLVALGQLAGVEYIVTGSLNSVEQKFIAQMKQDTSKSSSSQGEKVKLLMNIAAMANNAVRSGMFISTNFNLKVLDVKTAKLLYSKNIKGETSIGNIKNPSFDQVVGGIKVAVTKSLDQANKGLSEYFKLRGYIMQIKSNKKEKIALINLGKNSKVKPNDEFFIYNFNEIEDPMSGKTECDMTKSQISLRLTNQLQNKRSWGVLEGDNLNRIRLKQLVERKSKK